MRVFIFRFLSFPTVGCSHRRPLVTRCGRLNLENRIVVERSLRGAPSIATGRCLARTPLQSFTVASRLSTVAPVLIATMVTKPSPTKILVVDDDVRLRDLLTRYLGEQGFQVAGACGRARHRQEAAARPAAPRRARPHAARRGWLVGVPPFARRGRVGPDHHVDSEGRRRRSHRRSGNGRRRLPREAVQSARIGRAHPRRIAPPRRAPRGGRHPPRKGRSVSARTKLDLAARTLDCDGKPVALTTGEFSLLHVFVPASAAAAGAREAHDAGARPRSRCSIARSTFRSRACASWSSPTRQTPATFRRCRGFGYVYVPDNAAGLLPMRRRKPRPPGDASGDAREPQSRLKGERGRGARRFPYPPAGPPQGDAGARSAKVSLSAAGPPKGGHRSAERERVSLPARQGRQGRTPEREARRFPYPPAEPSEGEHRSAEREGFL